MPPLALITRCHGTTLESGCGNRESAVPTARAARGWPSIAATWPYVTTRPRGTRRTMAYTARANFGRDRALCRRVERVARITDAVMSNED